MMLPKGLDCRTYKAILTPENVPATEFQSPADRTAYSCTNAANSDGFSSK